MQLHGHLNLLTAAAPQLRDVGATCRWYSMTVHWSHGQCEEAEYPLVDQSEVNIESATYFNQAWRIVSCCRSSVLPAQNSWGMLMMCMTTIVCCYSRSSQHIQHANSLQYMMLVELAGMLICGDLWASHTLLTATFSKWNPGSRHTQGKVQALGAPVHTNLWHDGKIWHEE